MNARDLLALSALSAVVAVMSVGPAPVRAAVVYSEDFNIQDVPADLHGTAPDVADNAGGEIGAPSPTWVGGTGTAYAWKTDGSVNGAGAPGNGSSAYLPFTPAAGRVYTLSATITTNANSTDADGLTNQWIGVGFTQNAPTSGAGSRWVDTGPGAAVWVLHRNDHSAATGGNPDQTVVSRTGTNVTDPVGAINGPVDVVIVLDTRPAAWDVT